MSTSRKEILNLLANGKITADEAADLLREAPSATAVVDPNPPAPPKPAAPESGKKPSWLHVRVKDANSGKNKVTVNVPLGMLKFGLKIGGRFSPELNDLDWDEVQSMMDEMESGLLVDVQDDEGGEHVQVFVD